MARDQALTAGWRQIVVLDDPDQAGVLAYHEMTREGTPLGKVFAKLDIGNGTSWTVTLSHELLEILADPRTNWCALGSDSKIYALEVADAVEADQLGYEIDGVLLSNFVTPAWFKPKHNLSKQLELAPRGIHFSSRSAHRLDAIDGGGEGRADSARH